MSLPHRHRGRAPRTLLAALALAALAGGACAVPSTTLTVTSLVSTPTTYDLAGLQALPAVTQTDTYTSGGAPVTDTFTGASLWNVVSSAGVKVGSNKNDILDDYVLATGTDGYKVVYSMGELDPSFGNSGALVAYADTANTMAANGFARIVVPDDAKAGRFVSNLVSLEVFSADAVPEPAPAALLLGGLALLALARRSARH